MIWTSLLHSCNLKKACTCSPGDEDVSQIYNYKVLYSLGVFCQTGVIYNSWKSKQNLNLFFGVCFKVNVLLARILFVIIHQLNSLSLFWLAESVQWIFEISSIYLQIIRTITMSRTFKVSCNHVMYDCVSWVLKIKEFTHFGSLALSEDWSRNMTSFFFQSMYNKPIIRCMIHDIQNNQGLGKD